MPRRRGGQQARKGKKGAQPALWLWEPRKGKKGPQPTGAGQAWPRALALAGGEAAASGGVGPSSRVGFLNAGPRPLPLLSPAASRNHTKCDVCSWYDRFTAYRLDTGRQQWPSAPQRG